VPGQEQLRQLEPDGLIQDNILRRNTVYIQIKNKETFLKAYNIYKGIIPYEPNGIFIDNCCEPEYNTIIFENDEYMTCHYMRREYIESMVKNMLR
jgi:hypothetical protein